jgi:Cytochrome c554 and c-prime
MVRRTPTIAQEATPRRADTALKRELQGTASCSASACHGGSDIGKRLSEATTWRTLDPHASAYDALLTRESQAIGKRLWAETTLAFEAPLCLKCHVHPGYDRARPTFRKEDGAGCESCHGPAQDWLSPHYRESWKKLSGMAKQAHGLADTKSLAGRAGVCVQCHVGTPGHEVDHDLIAAGHPALRFEFATYFANLPPHWDVAKDKKANSTEPAKSIDFEVRAWVVGQLVTAARASDLLSHRADPQTGTHWPEFAELDCFSCHHDMQVAGWRRDTEHLRERRAGTLLWNSWYYTHLPEILSLAPQAKDATWAKASEDVREFLNRRDTKTILFDTERRGLLAKQAKQLSQALTAVVQAPPTFVGHDHGWADALVDRISESKSMGRSWEEATQRYLALLAFRQMHKDNKQPENAEVERHIIRLRDQVTFPRGFNSPFRFIPSSQSAGTYRK